METIGVTIILAFIAGIFLSYILSRKFLMRNVSRYEPSSIERKIYLALGIMGGFIALLPGAYFGFLFGGNFGGGVGDILFGSRMGVPIGIFWGISIVFTLIIFLGVFIGSVIAKTFFRFKRTP